MNLFVNFRKLRLGDTFCINNVMNMHHCVIDRIGGPNSSRYVVLSNDDPVPKRIDLRGYAIRVINRIDETEDDTE